MATTKFFNRALSIGRPPNIQKLFPNSKALIVSSKFINESMLKRKKSACIAVNGRNTFVIRGALRAAQKANSAIIIEIAKSEGGIDAYCFVNFWNIARIVDSYCNELNISIPIAIHADHYAIKSSTDVSKAIIEIPSLFDAGITSIAIDASHLSDEQNLLTNIKLNKLIPKWSGLETEIGEIKGKLGLSTKDEALFMARGLNAYNIFPEWLALNNGTTHGIESDGEGIQIELTAKIHNAISKYGISGAQHGTSGNSKLKLQKLISETRTTKANLATALQMISWGLMVNNNGNAITDENGNFIKIKKEGVSRQIWMQMEKYANNHGWDQKNYKKLNLSFENRLLSQPKKIRARMSKRVEDFTYDFLVNIFNSKDSAEDIIDSIVKTNSYQLEHKVERIENKRNWTCEKIMEKASHLNKNFGPSGNFED